MDKTLISTMKLGLSLMAGVSLLSFPAATLTEKLASPQLPADANQLVRTVIDKELTVGHLDHAHWKYQIRTREDEKETVKEIVETKNCDVDRTISVNGKPLSAQERQNEDARLNKLASDPEEQQKRVKATQQDASKAIDLFKILPDAFIYRYSGKEGSRIKLSFKPNPNFQPPSKEAQVFHNMEGTMWVTKDNRLAQLDGELTDDVKFFGGLIGHLDKGGTFSVKRSELSPGHWQTTLLAVKMNGKITIFKTIHLQKTDSMTNFQRVPRDLTPVQAAKMLQEIGPATDKEQVAHANGSNQRKTRR